MILLPTRLDIKRTNNFELTSHPIDTIYHQKSPQSTIPGIPGYFHSAGIFAKISHNVMEPYVGHISLAVNAIPSCFEYVQGKNDVATHR